MTGHIKVVVEEARREPDGSFVVDLAATLRGKATASVHAIAIDSVRKLFAQEDFDWLATEPLSVMVRPGTGCTPLGSFRAIYDGRTFRQLIGFVEYDFGSEDTAERAYFAFDLESRPLTDPEEPRRFDGVAVDSEHLPEGNAA